jgi:hypothetical protein
MLMVVVLSLALAVGAVWLGGKLSPRLGVWRATLAAAGAYVVTVAIVMLVLPPVAETPGPLTDPSGAIVYPGFSTDDLYHFGLYSLGAQVVLWATIALVFAPLAALLLDENRRDVVPA